MEIYFNFSTTSKHLVVSNLRNLAAYNSFSLTKRVCSTFQNVQIWITRGSLLVEIHSLLVTRCKITRYSLQNSLVTCCRSYSLQKFTRYSLQKLFVEKIHSLLVAKIARYSLQKLLVAKIHSLLVAKVARCKNSLVARSKIRSLLIAEVARSKQSLVPRCEICLLLVATNHALLVAKHYSSLVKTITSP